MKKTFLGLIILNVTLFLLAFTGIEKTFFPDTDFARDIYYIQKIASGDLTLIGPILRAGFYSGPYYYYLLAPFMFAISNSSSIIWGNALVGLVCINAIFLIISQKTNHNIALLQTLITLINPIFIISLRHPGNAYTYIPFLAVTVFYCLYFKPRGFNNYFLLGTVFGVLINFHPTTLIPIILIIFFSRYSRSRNNILATIMGTAATFTPLLVFELSKGFIITKGLLGGGLSNFFKNENIFPIYYLWGTIMFLYIYILKFFERRKYLLIKATIITVVIALFPWESYSPKFPSLKYYRSLVFKVTSLASIPKSNFNILEFTDEYKKVVSGHMIRFELKNLGYEPIVESDFSSPDTLIIFCRYNGCGPWSINDWEASQFGGSNINIYQKINVLNDSVYILKRSEK